MTKEETNIERERIGRQVADIRKEQGLTQQQLADIVGMQRNHISRIESGKFSVGLDTLAAIAKALGRHLNLTT